MFRRKIDWTVEPLTGDPSWQRHEAPRPNVLDVVDEAISRSGVDPREVNKVTRVMKITSVVEGAGAYYLRSGGDEAAADGFLKLGSRADYSVDLVWDYFSHHGVTGVAAQRSC